MQMLNLVYLVNACIGMLGSSHTAHTHHMHHTLGDINVRFVPSCVYAWYARQPFYHSMVDSTPQKFAIHATADPLHLDTNDSKAMHAGRSEAHFIAGMFVNLTPGLSRRLPFRAYHRVRISVCSACSARVCVGCVCVLVCTCLLCLQVFTMSWAEWADVWT